MEKIDPSDLELIRVGKTCVFSDGKQSYHASSRVANDILHGCDIVYFEEVIIPQEGKNIGKWLSTPSRF